MLEFLIGRACTGKTYDIVKRVTEDSKNGKVIFIVPEQFSFESERAVIKYENAVLDNIRVLSFSRLFDDVLDFSAVGSISCVSDFEKIILLKKALQACADDLVIFSKYTSYNDFIINLGDTIKDLKFAAVTPEQLITAAEDIGGTCSAKLRDIALVMSTYNALLHNKYIDPSDRLTKLAELLVDCDYFKDTTVYFDSFTGFTGQQYKIIEKIFEQTDKVTFSFCTDDINNTNISVFYNINNSVKRIQQIAKSRGISEYSVIKKSTAYYSNDAMQKVEHFLAKNQATPDALIGGSLKIISCKNKREEALAAANIVAKEVAENGYRFKDFIVVARNADDYANLFSAQCVNNNISCFMDKSVALTQTPLYLYLDKLFETLSSFSTDAILAFLKIGLTNYSLNEISELEDYTFIWDIKPADWATNWEMSVKGLRTDEDNEYDTAKLEQINRTRSSIVEVLSEFKNDFHGSPKSMAKAIYNHLVKYSVDKNLLTLCDYFENNGNQYYASILKQSWDLLISILNSMVRVLDDNTNSAEFIDLFRIAASNAKISNIPQMLDEVTFGAADRIRPSKPKISIILGANQGVFPKISVSSGLLSMLDKQKLLDRGIFLDDPVRGAVEENYLVYSMLCCPVDKVYVLYSETSVSGEELSESTFVSDLTENFGDIKVEKFELSSEGNYIPRTEKSAFSEIGSLDSQSFADVKDSLSNNPSYSQKLRFVNNEAYGFEFEISKENAERLFGNEIHISATKFDTFHRCKLSYLLKSGLRINKLQKADLNVLQRGTIAHFVLETMVSKHRGGLANLSVLQISAEVDSLIHEYMASVNGSELLMTPRFAYLLEKISESVKQVVYHIAQEFAQSGFEPAFCELSIGTNGDIPTMEYVLEGGSKLSFEGKIDRVDVYKDHVRVVDYKTGKKSFVLSDILVGLNMQMLLYLYAFVKNGKELVDDPKPAGILYMPAKASKDKKSLRMNGLILRNDEIRAAMEQDNKGVYVPKFSDKSSDYVDEEFFDLIFNRIDQLIKEMGTDILMGRFNANPTDGVKSDACAYCDYAGICRSKNSPHKKVDNCSNEQIRNILKEENGNGIKSNCGTTKSY